MNPHALTAADFAELARRWEGTPHLPMHQLWQERTMVAQGTAAAPAPTLQPVPVSAPAQWSLFD